MQDNLSSDHLPSGRLQSDERTENRISTSQLSGSALGGGLPGPKASSRMKTCFYLSLLYRSQSPLHLRRAIDYWATPPPPDRFYLVCTMSEHLKTLWNSQYFILSRSTKVGIHTIQRKTSLFSCGACVDVAYVRGAVEGVTPFFHCVDPSGRAQILKFTSLLMETTSCWPLT